MIALYIIAAILLLLLLVTFLPVTLTVKYREGLSAEISVLAIKRRLYPKEKKKIRVSDYSKKNIEKHRKKALKKRLKAEKKRQKKQKPQNSGAPAPSAKKRGLVESIELIKELLSVLIPNTAKRVKIKATKIIINVATDDAAKTALLFPAVNGAVLGLVTYLDDASKFRGLDRSSISVNADFVSQKTTADIDISFSLRGKHILEILFATALKYVTQKTKK